MKRYFTPREIYKFAAVITSINIGIVGTIVFYPTTKLPAYVALLSIVLGALCGIAMGGIASAGAHFRETNKIDIPYFLIRVLFFALPYMGISYLITKVHEKWDMVPLAAFAMIAGAGLYLFIWYMKHGWNSKRE
jgi:hypothetical protein